MTNVAVTAQPPAFPTAVIAAIQAWAQPTSRFSLLLPKHSANRAPVHPKSASPPTPLSDPTLWLYRGRTCSLLRRFLRMSVEVGRVPSLLGREFFRSRVSSSRAATFEDAVIFVHDVERSLDKLDDFQKAVIVRIIFQDYSQEETANLLQCHVRTVGRRFVAALDRLSDMFLRDAMLLRLPDTTACGKPCQGDLRNISRPSPSQHDK